MRKIVGVVTSSIMINENFFNGLALIKTNFVEKDVFSTENGGSINIKKPISFTQPY